MFSPATSAAANKDGPTALHPFIHHGATSAAQDKIKQFLKSEMVKSKRRGYWFRLSPFDRSYFGLAMRLNIRFRSQTLVSALVKIVKRLKELGDAAYNSLMEGMKVAWAFSEAAVSWGNGEARAWRNDMWYIRYLAANIGMGSRK